MPAAETDYYGHDSTAYDDYDDMSEESHQAGTQWQNGSNGHAQHNGSYQTPTEEREDYQLPNPRLRVPPPDEIGRHMLYETALMDCKAFDLLSLEEVDTLKKELSRLTPRIEAAQKKLILENKVRDAARNLQKLNVSRGSRVDTPQSPDSPRKIRRSIIGHRQSVNLEKQQQIEDEVFNIQKKVEELNESLKQLLDRRAQVERSLLRHTAAVLAQQSEEADSRHRSLNDDAVSEYEPDEFDGIRDILGGRTINKSSKRIQTGGMSIEHEQHLQSMQTRLDQLNSQLRSIIQEASRHRGESAPADPVQALSDDPSTQLDHDLTRLEANITILGQEQHNILSQSTQARSDSQQVASKLENLTTSLHKTIMQSSSSRNLDGISEPPRNVDHHEHVGYLQQLMISVESMFHAHHEDRQALQKTAGHSQKLDEYESTVSGLWDLLTNEGTTDESGNSRSPRMSESFSLAAFSSRVQNVSDRANSAREQQNILLRQIQQQRELNNRSDEEKDKQLTELQRNHEEVLIAHTHLQDEMAKTIASHASSENEASQLRAEMANVENEFEQLHKTAETKRQEHEEMARQLQIHQSSHEQTRDALLEAQSSHEETRSALLDAQKALAQHTNARQHKDKEMEDLESEVVRLTTELTMARAELDAAYGSRAERAKEARAGEAEGLKERSSALEQELAAMTSEFQDLTRASLEMERERSQLDTTIDGLRERCEALEAQLADEKVNRIGVRSPTGESLAREQTTMVVMRSEFKKMMRDARTEGVKLLRAEQEQRRAAEAELRRIRLANTPLRKPPVDVGTAVEASR